MLDYFKRKKAEKQEANRKSREDQWQREVSICAKKTDKKLRDEIKQYENHLKEIDFDFRIMSLAGKTGRLGPIHHCQHRLFYTRLIDARKAAIKSRKPTS